MIISTIKEKRIMTRLLGLFFFCGSMIFVVLG